MKNLLTLLLLTGCSFLGGQSTEYMPQEILVHFGGVDNNSILADINSQLPPEKQIIERWASPLTKTRIWYFPEFDFEFEYGNDPVETFFIENVIDANESTHRIIRPGGPGGTSGGSDLIPIGSYNVHASANSTSTSINCMGDYSLTINNGEFPVKVSVVDSGLNFDEDGSTDYPLNPIVTSGKAYEGFDTDPNPNDLNGHGTHVLGTVNRIARFHNPLGETTIEFDVRRILDSGNVGNLGNLILAIEEAMVNGAKIINLSLGYMGSAEENPFLNRIKELVEAKNVLLVISAGNDATNVVSSQISGDVDDVIRILPAALQSPNIITVGSVNCRTRFSRFSNYSNTLVDIAAPGENIVGYNNNGELVELTGTSQATAIVTGVAASLATHMAQFDAPSIKCAIMSSAQTDLNLGGYLVSSGILNADGALSYLFSHCYGADTRSIASPENDINVYPNPFSSSITLDLNRGLNQIKIVNMMGQVVYQNAKSIQTDIEELTINLELEGRMFILSITNEAGKTVSKKIFKQ